ncbi:MAG: DUF3078 domain-containing protein [Fibrobacteria bacterium]|nr:DUF3078 domain-containing protein [Fibrobacteria bacterium]
MKSIVAIPLISLAAGYAQDSAAIAPSDSSLWSRQVIASANFASSYFSDWAQGGEDNLAWSFKLDAKAERDGEDWTWTNTGKAEFGQVKQGDFAPRKSADEFKLETMVVRKLTTMLNPFSAASMKSQFAFGYKYPKDGGGREAVSDWLDPAYFTQSLGLGYKPVDFFRTRLGFAVQETWTNGFRRYTDDSTTAGRERWKIEPGMEWVTSYDQTLFQNLSLKSELGVFANFKGLDEVDAVWGSSLAWQFTHWVNVNLTAEARRDLGQFDGWQWKHVLALGLTANLL